MGSCATAVVAVVAVGVGAPQAHAAPGDTTVFVPLAVPQRLLDTPLPSKGVVARADRLRIQWQRLLRRGPGYLWQWARSRWEWERARLRRRLGRGDEPAAAPSGAFQSQAIEAAFRGALAAYRVEPQPLATALFRPALDRAYDLGGGRFANTARELVLPDNGWTPYVADLRVVEVPGDHDSMVLEPNVRSLAAQLRQALQAATAVRRADGAAGAVVRP